MKLARMPTCLHTWDASELGGERICFLWTSTTAMHSLLQGSLHILLPSSARSVPPPRLRNSPKTDILALDNEEHQDLLSLFQTLPPPKSSSTAWRSWFRWQPLQIDEI
mmetsp:Transcript_92132/g.162592  ORF Transcript_92132/g.162592 Transcript_92132/m.162592 type:complete len:108 (-) Transcript_92132:553-876(-)